jgi:thiol-disulfide isomerase/thioredoxin
MRFFNRQFFIGVGVGVALTIGAIVGVGAILVMIYVPSLEELGAMLPAPEFPDREQLPIYGQVDYDWSVRQLDGTETALSAFRDQVVFLNVWATHCPPCIAEMPSIQALRSSLEAEDIRFLLVTEESAATVEKFLRDHPSDLPIYLYDELPNVLRPPGLPTTYVINREGLIVHRRIGGANWDSETSRGFLRDLMRKGAGSAPG